MKPIHAAIYVKATDKETALSQTQKLKEIAINNGAVKIAQDNIYTDFRLSSEGLQQLLAGAESNQFQVLYLSYDTIPKDACAEVKSAVNHIYTSGRSAIVCKLD